MFRIMFESALIVSGMFGVFFLICYFMIRSDNKRIRESDERSEEWRRKRLEKKWGL